MTTQLDLLEIAKRHRDNPAICALRTAITEAKTQAVMAKVLLVNQLDITDRFLCPEASSNVPMDNSEITDRAVRLTVALSKISHDFYTLACALQALGETIDY